MSTSSDRVARDLVSLDSSLNEIEGMRDLDSNSRAGILASMLLAQALNEFAASVSDIGPAIEKLRV